jgi:hypothetical protein
MALFTKEAQFWSFANNWAKDRNWAAWLNAAYVVMLAVEI